MGNPFRESKFRIDLMEQGATAIANGSSQGYAIGETRISLPSVSSDGLIDYQSYIAAARDLASVEPPELDYDTLMSLDYYLRLLESASVIEELIRIYSDAQEPDLDTMSIFSPVSSRIRGSIHPSLEALASQTSRIGSSPATDGSYAIVLEPIYRSRSGDFQRQVNIEQRRSALRNLSRDAITQNNYTVFVLSNIGVTNEIPQVTAIDSQTGRPQFTSGWKYPVARLSGLASAQGKILATGTLVKVRFESVDAHKDLIISDITEDDVRFTTLVANSLLDRSSLIPEVLVQRSSATSVSHPIGDPTCTEGCDQKNLRLMYKELQSRVGENRVNTNDLFTYLMTVMQDTFGFSDEKLVLALVLNAYVETARTMDANIVSGMPVESSIGLWQFNVGSNGWINVKNGAILTLETASGKPWHPDVEPPSTAPVMPYFLGGLLLKNGPATSGPAAALHSPSATNFLPSNSALPTGIEIPTIITRKNYRIQFNADPNELVDSYAKVRDWRNQCIVIVEAAKHVLEATPGGSNYAVDSMDAEKWTAWIQVYLEQPGRYKDRYKPYVRKVIKKLEQDGVDANLLRQAQAQATIP